MKISIIIPVYNCEKFIANCIDSVLQQTWRDYEIMVYHMQETLDCYMQLVKQFLS